MLQLTHQKDKDNANIQELQWAYAASTPIPLPTEFDGTDYPQWRLGMRNFLLYHHLLGIVTGDEIAPEHAGPPLTLYNRRMEVAASVISYCVNERTNVYLDSANGDSKKMWDLLEKRYAPTNVTYEGMHGIYTAKLEGGGSLHNDFARLG